MSPAPSAAVTATAAVAPEGEDAALDRLQRRILWLAVRIVDHANRERPATGLKVGGHQASSASMVSVMTSLWFGHLRAADRVAVKPHASPVLHAIQYLLGNLQREDLLTLRAFKGLQAYPSITKDRFDVDFSTGSVGLGAVAPLFAAVTRRYVDTHFPDSHSSDTQRDDARFFALLGDAELDEGNVWEAIADPMAQGGLGNLTWIIDLNRQSLDRVIPGVKAARLKRMFDVHGWQVLEAKYGHRLSATMAAPGGEALRAWIDEMPNEQYQRSVSLRGPQLRKAFLDGADPAVDRALADVADEELSAVVHDLGGHDLATLRSLYAQADEEQDRPTVIFAYTVKGWGLPIAGDPLNHSALLTGEQVDGLRDGLAREGVIDPEDDWAAFEEGSAEAALVAQAAEHLRRPQPSSAPLGITVPAASGLRATKPVSTQASLGRIVSRLGRQPQLRERMVTTSPDVAVSTGLAGWINAVGIFHAARTTAGEAGGLLRWEEHALGRHIELGISEMNLFSLLGQLGDAQRLHGERLLPIGTLYDPFVCRGLDALIHATYSGARFVVAGTPSGVSLSPEGGAHQSTITASIGLELPNIVSAEPAYVAALDWLLCAALESIANDEQGEAFYLRLTTRELDQEPFEAARQRLGEEALRSDVLAGAYRLVEPAADGPPVTICASGAIMPEAIAAASELADEGVAAAVVDVTSLDRLYRGWRGTLTRSIHGARRPQQDHHLRTILGPRPGPLVTVHDASPHAMAFLGSAVGQPVVPLGVDDFGQSGTIADLYDTHQLTTGHIVNAACAALDLQP